MRYALIVESTDGKVFKRKITAANESEAHGKGVELAREKGLKNYYISVEKC